MYKIIYTYVKHSSVTAFYNLKLHSTVQSDRLPVNNVPVCFHNFSNIIRMKFYQDIKKKKNKHIYTLI